MRLLSKKSTRELGAVAREFLRGIWEGIGPAPRRETGRKPSRTSRRKQK